jgi:hypothetical protein
MHSMGMHIDERDLAESAAGFQMDHDAAWYAARQPGVIRFVEDRLSGDALAVALVASWQLMAAFHARMGVWPERLDSTLLERAEEAALRETRREAPLRPGSTEGGCAARQPVLIDWIVNLLADPPVPLDVDERRDVGLALMSVVYALDEVTTGRTVPGVAT